MQSSHEKQRMLFACTARKRLNLKPFVAHDRIHRMLVVLPFVKHSASASSVMPTNVPIISPALGHFWLNLGSSLYMRSGFYEATLQRDTTGLMESTNHKSGQVSYQTAGHSHSIWYHLFCASHPWAGDDGRHGRRRVFMQISVRTGSTELVLLITSSLLPLCNVWTYCCRLPLSVYVA